MVYAFLLKDHPNERARAAVEKLACIELQTCLMAEGVTNAKPDVRDVGGIRFLCVELADCSDTLLKRICSQSFVSLAAELLPNELLRPIRHKRKSSLPEELPHVLKYKGKTNADFTRMMLNCAFSLSNFSQSPMGLKLIDPMCGKGTTLFCGAVEGMSGTGLDIDRKELREADQYLGKSLQLHRISYLRKEDNRTLRKGGFAHAYEYTISSSEKEKLQLSLIECDLQKAPWLFRPGSFHLMVSDLPYGVQHAPHEGKALSSLEHLAKNLSQCAFELLKPGGALAFSFNEKTLRRDFLAGLLQDAGLKPLNVSPFDDCSHWLEQAIVRNIVFAKKDH